jgi:hypothetical protein
MNFRYFKRISLVIFLLTACSTTSGPFFQLTTAQLFIIPLTSHLPLISSTILSIVTSAKSGIITDSPASPPIPAPLTSPGPWLVVNGRINDSLPQNYYVTGLTGNDWTPLAMPEVSGQPIEWILTPSAKGGYMVLSQSTPNFTEQDQSGYELFIVKLPENKIIKTIPLLGPMAITSIQNATQNNESNHLRVLTNSRILHWSPDGRYLAFTAAINTIYPSVYLYDTSRDKIERLPLEDSGTIPWDWSPDGEWLLYYQTTDNEYEEMMNLPYEKALSAYSLKTKTHYSFNSQWYDSIQWMSDHSFFAFQSYECVTCGHNLRKVNLSYGSAQTLFKGDFTRLLYNPDTRSVLLDFTPNTYLDFDVESGVYLLNDEYLTTKMFIPGFFVYSQWSQELKNFIVLSEQEMFADNNTPIFYDPNGKEVFRLPESQYSISDLDGLKVSPDGHWFYIHNQDKTSLYNKQGQFIKEFNENALLWLNDSSGLLQVDLKGESIYLFEQNKNWEPHLLHSSLYGDTYWMQFLINP